MARSQPQYDSYIIVNIPKFELHDSYKKYSFKKKSVYMDFSKRHFFLLLIGVTILCVSWPLGSVA